MKTNSNTVLPHTNKHLSRNSYSIWLALAILSLFSFSAFAGPKAEISDRCRDALLTESWAIVVEECAESRNQASPVFAHLAGHACLALNKNNQALASFGSFANAEDLQQWHAWCQDFAKRHTNRAVAQYLLGDALARIRDWNGSLRAFRAALLLNNNHFLSLNGRGVVLQLLGKTSEAQEDFLLATQTNPNFAEAFASLGKLNIDRHAIQGATQAYTKANDLSPKYDLISLGMGCTAYARHRYEDAEAYFETVSNESPVSSIARENRLAMQIERLNRILEQASAVGMSLKRVDLGTADNATEQAYAQSRGLLAKEGAKPLTPEEMQRLLLEEGYKQLERWRDEYAKNCSGASAGSAYCRNLAAKIKALEDAIQAYIGKPSPPDEGKSQKPKLSVKPAELRLLSLLVRPDFSKRLSGYIRLAEPDLNAVLANRSIRPGQIAVAVQKNVGGVTSAGVDRIPSNSGRWVVRSSHGLLYPTPAD